MRIKHGSTTLLTAILLASVLVPIAQATQGDADLDGDVDIGDFWVLERNLGKNLEDCVPPGVDPDFDNDGFVDPDDFYILLENYLEYIENWSFEDRDYSIPGDGVHECPPWQTNNGGWRELRGDIDGNGMADADDVFTYMAAAYGSKIGDPNYNPDCDFDGDGDVDIDDVNNYLAPDYGKTTKRVDGSYSWYTSGGGDYLMWQWLNSNVIDVVKGKTVAFSFWFYPKSVASDGSKNKAQAGIYYEYQGESNTVYGDVVSPTETKWYDVSVAATLPNTTTAVKVLIHGFPDFRSWVDSADFRVITTSTPPYAYSTDFEFIVPNNDDGQLTYYLRAEVYVPWGKTHVWFKAVQVNDWVTKVYINRRNKYSGSTQDPPCQPLNVDLGPLSKGYHILELYYVEKWAAGSLKFYVSLDEGADSKAYLTKFQVYTPKQIGTIQYEVKTYTHLTIDDDYYLVGYANDFIDEVYVNGLKRQDWEWDLGEYGNIYAWEDGFLYPLGQYKGWYDISFVFGDVGNAGRLDFQYISWTNQQELIGNPRFWSQVDLTAGDGIMIYETKIYGGSKWDADPGTSFRFFSVGIDLLVNTTHPDYIPKPARALLGVSIGWMKLDPVDGTYVDLGITLNLTSLGAEYPTIPIYTFHPYSIEIFAPSQAVRIPTTALVFYNTPSETSFISPDFKVVAPFLGRATTGLLWWKLSAGTGILAGPFGVVATIAAGVGVELFFNYLAGQTVQKTYEEAGTSTYRKLKMDSFTSEDGAQALFARVIPDYSFHCGSIKIVVHGTLYFLFYYKTGAFAYGFPVDVDVTFIVPIFVRE